jgi:hypothetical protein
MIKKLLTTASLLALFGAANAQNAKLSAESAPAISKKAVQPASMQASKTSSVAIGDTLWYFFNKHFYRNPSGTGYFTVKSPYQSSAVTLTHFGCRFLNTGSLMVNGLEAVVSRHSASSSASVTVNVILCNVVGGQPVLPGVDSISAVLTGTAATFVGGDFTVPKVMTGDFAVVYRCASPAGDTIRAWMNNAAPATATVPVAQRYGEGLGHVRIATTFTNMTGVFGPQSDYEFLVAPRVGFVAQAAQNSPPTSPYCVNKPYTFTNASSAWLTHRQYNLNQFYKTWKPFANTVSTINPDSVLTWDFGDGTGPMYAYNQVHTYMMPGSFTGTLTAKYQPMADIAGTSVYTDMATFTKSVAPAPSVSLTSSSNTICTSGSGGTAVTLTGSPSGGVYSGPNVVGNQFTAPAAAGSYTATYSYTDTATGCSNATNDVIVASICMGMVEFSGTELINVYPNPSANGHITIANLPANTEVQIINMLGQSVYKEKASGNLNADLSNLNNGSYFVKITSGNEKAKIVKLILN